MSTANRPVEEETMTLVNIISSVDTDNRLIRALELIKKTPSAMIDTQDSNGYTPLMLAVQPTDDESIAHDNNAIVMALLEKDAKTDHISNGGVSALSIALRMTTKVRNTRRGPDTWMRILDKTPKTHNKALTDSIQTAAFSLQNALNLDVIAHVNLYTEKFPDATFSINEDYIEVLKIAAEHSYSHLIKASSIITANDLGRVWAWTFIFCVALEYTVIESTTKRTQRFVPTLETFEAILEKGIDVNGYVDGVPLVTVVRSNLRYDVLPLLIDKGATDPNNGTNIDPSSLRKKTSAATLAKKLVVTPGLAVSYAFASDSSVRNSESELLLLAGAPMDRIPDHCVYTKRIAKHITEKHGDEPVHFNACCLQQARPELATLISQCKK